MSVEKHIEHYQADVKYYAEQVSIWEGGKGQIGTYEVVDGKRVDTTEQHIKDLKGRLSEAQARLKMWTDYKEEQQKLPTSTATWNSSH